jgi:hypothetical protein
MICVLLFCVGLAKLFWLRFESGDLYPLYSSLRGDPLGTQVLFESLNRILENSAQRNFHPLNQLDVKSGSTLFVIGLAGQGAFLKDPAWEPLLEKIALNGGRLVISFRSSATYRPASHKAQGADDEEEERWDLDDEEIQEQDATPESHDPEKERPSSITKDEQPIDSDDSWIGALATLGIEIKPMEEKSFGDVAQRDATAPESLPAMIPWRSPLFFRLNDSAWQTLYQWEDAPVVVIRPWGAGTVVMATDSYLFSNEALRADRFPDLLAWLIQPPHGVIVDEFHNGLSRNPGIAHLMYKYRLHGVLASLAILLILLLWRQTSGFAIRPADARPAAHDIEAGSDTAEGLTALMRQHIHESDLLKVCFDAWHASASASRVTHERMRHIQRIVTEYSANPRRKDLVATYKQICELLRQGKPS